MEKYFKVIEKQIFQKGQFPQLQKGEEKPNYQIAFTGESKNYCVGLIDMVESTKISANLHEREWCKLYEIFLNSMAKILQRFGGVVIKNGGDSLLYYFPDSCRQNSNYGLISCLECTTSP